MRGEEKQNIRDDAKEKGGGGGGSEVWRRSKDESQVCF